MVYKGFPKVRTISIGFCFSSAAFNYYLVQSSALVHVCFESFYQMCFIFQFLSFHAIAKQMAYHATSDVCLFSIIAFCCLLFMVFFPLLDCFLFVFPPCSFSMVFCCILFLVFPLFFPPAAPSLDPLQSPSLFLVCLCFSLLFLGFLCFS